MGGAFVGFVFPIVVALLFGALFTAMGMLLFVKPKGIRPGGNGAGMKPDCAKVEKPLETPVVDIQKPVVIETKVEPKADPKPPRW